jgi:hypothetical protein
MLRISEVTMPGPEPLALLDATLLFLVQVLIAQHPDLLLPPELPEPRPPPGLRAAQRLLDGVRELHHALDAYRAMLPEARATEGRGAISAEDDIPF